VEALARTGHLVTCAALILAASFLSLPDPLSSVHRETPQV